MDLTWNINDPNMGDFERIGLAGLFMTLKQSQRDGRQFPFSFEATKESVRIYNDDDDDAKCLEALFGYAYQIVNGSLFVPAIGQDDPFHSARSIKLMCSTFFLHPMILKKDWVKTTYVVDDKQTVFSRCAVRKDSVLPAHRDWKKLVEKNGKLKDIVKEIASHWLLLSPATDDGSEPIVEKTNIVLLYMFIPIATVYREINHRFPALIFPNVVDLEDYYYRFMSLTSTYAEFFDSGKNDLTMRFASQWFVRTVNRGLNVTSCLVAIVKSHPGSGKLSWPFFNRVNNIDAQAIENYNLVRQAFPNTWEKNDKKDEKDDQETYWVRAPRVRDILAKNLLNKVRWYVGLEQLKIGWIAKNLRQKVNGKSLMDTLNETEEQFIDAYHKVWSVKLGKAAAGKKGDEVNRAFKKLDGKELRAIRNCRTAMHLHQYVDEFMASMSGSELWNKTLAMSIRRMIDDNWEQVRSLCHLAFGTYVGKNNGSSGNEPDKASDTENQE